MIFLLLLLALIAHEASGVLVVAEGPQLVLAGSKAILRCFFDLQGEPLNSVKWYRDQVEFFRYRPEQTPPLRIFPRHGINVDISGSNVNQVTLQNIPTNLTGEFVCEVSADGPKFNTGRDSTHVTVTDKKIRKPLLHLSSSVYRPGSSVKIQCLAQSIDHTTKVIFLINEVQVERRWIKEIYPGVWELMGEALEERMADCEGFKGFPIWLRCEAGIPGIYQMTSASVPVLFNAENTSGTRKMRMRPLLLEISLSLLYLHYTGSEK